MNSGLLDPGVNGCSSNPSGKPFEGTWVPQRNCCVHVNANAAGRALVTRGTRFHSIPNLHAEVAAVVAVAVIIDRQKQPTVDGSSEGQLTADKKRCAGLAIGQSNVADERSGARGGYRLRGDD